MYTITAIEDRNRTFNSYRVAVMEVLEEIERSGYVAITYSSLRDLASNYNVAAGGQFSAAVDSLWLSGAIETARVARDEQRGSEIIVWRYGALKASEGDYLTCEQVFA